MSKVVLLDGAVGTSLWEKTNDKVPVWRYNIENPAIVAELHKEYADAGAEIILANTFGANGPSVKKSSDYTVKEVVTNAMNIIHDSIQDRAKIALSVGPLSELLEPYGDLTEEEAYEIFDEQISWGVEGKPDIICIQTFMDIEMMKIAVKAASRHNLPIFCAMSFDKSAHTMMGNTPKDMIDGLKDYSISAIGLNCSIGPDAAAPIMKQFRENTDIPLMFKPNAGKPMIVNGKAEMQFDIDTFVRDAITALDYGVTYIGGCCGSNAKYVAKLKEAIEARNA